MLEPVVAKNLRLVVATAAEEAVAAWAVGDGPDWVAVKGLEVLERLELAAHVGEVPNLKLVVRRPTYESRTVWVYADRLNRLLVAVELDLMRDGQRRQQRPYLLLIAVFGKPLIILDFVRVRF